MEYKVGKYGTHEKMEEAVNTAARDGWEPLHYAVHAVWRGFANHFVMFVRR